VIEVKLPSLGADMDAGTLLEWRVHPGDAVKKGDVIAVIDTTKAALDVEAWHDGKVLDLCLAVGEHVPVGTLMLRLLEPGDDPRAIPPPIPRVSSSPTTTVDAPRTQAPPIIEGRRPVSPAARSRAATLGIDLEGVTGTGPGGVVTLKDVEALTASRSPRAAALRMTIAAAMARSKREIPHY
jgi:pyruvate dehydrogenase E2 component (dihydrolipoamide acetyltransferase)